MTRGFAFDQVAVCGVSPVTVGQIALWTQVALQCIPESMQCVVQWRGTAIQIWPETENQAGWTGQEIDLPILRAITLFANLTALASSSGREERVGKNATEGSTVKGGLPQRHQNSRTPTLHMSAEI